MESYKDDDSYSVWDCLDLCMSRVAREIEENFFI